MLPRARTQSRKGQSKNNWSGKVFNDHSEWAFWAFVADDSKH